MTFAMIALLLASTNTAATANQAPQPEGGAVVEKAKEEKKICKKPESTGSRLAGGKKVCMTAEQWRKTDMSGF